MGVGRQIGIRRPPRVEEMPEAFVVFLSAREKKRLVAALRRVHRDRGVALMRLVGRGRGMRE